MSFFSRLFGSSSENSANSDTSASQILSHVDNPPPLPPTPPPSPLLKEPWRKYKALLSEEKWPEKHYTTLLEQISKYEEKINILFVGQIQSGKSSTINSIVSIAEGRICEPAKAAQSEKSFTVQLNVIPGTGKLEKLTFFDLMGLELSESQGVKNDDILFATKGQIAPGTILNPSAPQTPLKEIEGHKIHCVMYIADGENIEQGMARDFKKKIEDIEEKLKTGPNRVVLVTKVDNICPEVRKDIRNIFHSRLVEKAVQNAAKCYGVTPNKVYPVHNYVDAVELEEDRNIPPLLALKAAVEMGIDTIRRQWNENQQSKASTYEEK